MRKVICTCDACGEETKNLAHVRIYSDRGDEQVGDKEYCSLCIAKIKEFVLNLGEE